MTGTLIDNDVLIKASAFGFGDLLAAVTKMGGTNPAILGVAPYVVRDRLARKGGLQNPKRAAANFDGLAAQLGLLEPSDDELSFAADLESKASVENLPLDGGESQLLAILITRGSRLLLTGDKRAIMAIEALTAECAADRIACFEQFLITLTLHAESGAICGGICSEANLDKAAAICCRCASGAAVSSEGLVEALCSYIGSVRQDAPTVLFADDDLSALAA